MFKNLVLITSLVFLGSCSSKNTMPETTADGKIPVEHFFRNPVARNIVVSPDGQMLASLQPSKSNRMNVFIRKVGETQWTQLTTIDDRDIAGMFWKGNDTILFTKDFGGDENFHLFSVNIKDKKSQDLTNFPNTRVNVVDDLEDVSTTDVLIGMNKRDPKVFDVYRVNVFTGQMYEVLQNDKNYTGYVIDHKGELRMAIATDGVNNTYYYRPNAKKNFKKVIALNFKDALAPIVFDAKNKNVFGLTDRKSVV